MKFLITNKVQGELSISSIRKSGRSGGTLILSEEESNHPHVQQFVQQGILKPLSDGYEIVPSYQKFVNKTKSNISISCLKISAAPGAVFGVPNTLSDDPEIISLINAGFIFNLSELEKDEEASGSKEQATSKKSAQKSTKKKSSKRSSKRSTKKSAKKSSKKIKRVGSSGKNEELDTEVKVSSGSPVEETDMSEGKSLIESQAETVENPEGVYVHDPRKEGLRVKQANNTPKDKSDVFIDSDQPESGESITFVDKQQIAERAKQNNISLDSVDDIFDNNKEVE